MELVKTNTIIPVTTACIYVVQSVALNPVGYKLMGMLGWPIATLPAIPEQDVSGTIVDANGVARWQVGDGEFT